MTSLEAMVLLISGTAIVLLPCVQFLTGVVSKTKTR
jgi:hypothetical protein